MSTLFFVGLGTGFVFGLAARLRHENARIDAALEKIASLARVAGRREAAEEIARVVEADRFPYVIAVRDLPPACWDGIYETFDNLRRGAARAARDIGDRS